MQKMRINLTKKQLKSDIERAIDMQCEYVISKDFNFTGFLGCEENEKSIKNYEKDLPFLKNAIKIGILEYLQSTFRNFLKWRFKLTKPEILDEAQTKLIASSWNEWRHRNSKNLAKDIYSTIESHFIFNS